MPAGTVARTETTFSVTVRDISGELARVSITASGAITDAQQTALVTAIANATNGRVEETNLTVSKAYTLVDVFDEAHNSVTIKLLCVYQNPSTGKTVRFELPAPDASLFADDGATAKQDNAQFTALNNAVLAIIGSSFTLTRAVLAQRSRRIVTRPAAPRSVEPGTNSLPPNAPGLPPQN